MELRYSGTLLDDLTVCLKDLGELFSSQYPSKSKDQIINTMIRDARIRAFLLCHEIFSNFLKSIYDQSHLFYPEINAHDDKLYFALKVLLKENIIKRKHFSSILEQFEAALYLTFDRDRIIRKSDKKLFDESAECIAQFYYVMSAISSKLSKDAVVLPRRRYAKEAEQ